MTVTVINTNIDKVENKAPDISDLVTTTVLNTKVAEIENEITDVSSCLVKKTNYNPNILDI